MRFTYIDQIECGEKNVTIGSLEKIYRSLNISFEELFEGLGPSQKNPDTQQKIIDLINASSAQTPSVASFWNTTRSVRRINCRSKSRFAFSTYNKSNFSLS